jgi:tetratricopeptide (TPR) repeat protein
MRIILAVELVRAGRLDDALEQFERGRKLDPTNPLMLGLGPSLPATHWLVYVAQGRDDMAVEALQRTAVLRGATTRELAAMREAFATGGMRAFWRSWLAMDLRQSGGNVDPLRMAATWASIGDANQALDWLERAYAERTPGLIYLRTDPAFASLRSNARYAAVVTGMKFPAR